MGFFDKIKAGLAKTRQALSNTLDEVFTGYNEIDDDFYDELEETLILADLGVDTATKVVAELRRRAMNRGWCYTEHAKFGLKQILTEMLNVGDTALNLNTTPSVILVIGVNGVGKTTTIGKIAKQLVPLRRTSWKSGPAEAALPSCASMRARTPHPWSLTASSPPGPRAAM